MPSKGRREVIMSKVWSLFLWLGLPCLCVICFSQSWRKL
uniref:Putative membrane protein n=1 Tax=Klebsiella pneumoniae TaxID=573 RepID=U5N6W8_KLEPN|nr:putative membrane protein [Klebsiella pneumoniae]